MKKLIFLFSILFSLICCQKIESVNSELQEDLVYCSFSFKDIQGNILTKSFKDEVLSNIVYDYPTIIELRGKKTYKINLTESQTFSIQKGRYFLYTNTFTGCDYDYMWPWRGYAEDPNILHSVKNIPLIAKSKGYYITIDENRNYEIELEINAMIIACEKQYASYFMWKNLYGCLQPAYGGKLSDVNRKETDNFYYYILSWTTEATNAEDPVSGITIEIGETDSTEQTSKNLDSIKWSTHTGKYFIFSPYIKDFVSFSEMTIKNNWEDGGTY